jgi:hypothetical protein
MGHIAGSVFSCQVCVSSRRVWLLRHVCVVCMYVLVSVVHSIAGSFWESRLLSLMKCCMILVHLVLVCLVTNCCLVLCSANGQVCSLYSEAGLRPRYELAFIFSCPVYKAGQAGSALRGWGGTCLCCHKLFLHVLFSQRSGSLYSEAGLCPRYELNSHFSCPPYTRGQVGFDYALRIRGQVALTLDMNLNLTSAVLFTRAVGQVAWHALTHEQPNNAQECALCIHLT